MNTKAAQDVLAERQRQIDREGWTPEHDDDHECGEIAAAAAYYAMPPAAREWPATETGYGDTFGEAIAPTEWVMKDYGDRRRELVIAAALLLAEIERIDRAAGVMGPSDGCTAHTECLGQKCMYTAPSRPAGVTVPDSKTK